MRRTQAAPIGQLIRQYLRQEGLETPLAQQRLLDAWPEMMGPIITSYTRELFICDRTLVVHLSSAVLRQELSSSRDMIVRNLNQRVGVDVITDIVFR